LGATRLMRALDGAAAAAFGAALGLPATAGAGGARLGAGAATVALGVVVARRCGAGADFFGTGAERALVFRTGVAGAVGLRVIGLEVPIKIFRTRTPARSFPCVVNDDQERGGKGVRKIR